jgi:glycosyltransferase involved in cell wall biosynthesis
MRIALVGPFGLRSKGTTRARALPLGRELARRGHAVALFIPPYDCPQDSGRRWREGDVAAEKVEVVNVRLPAWGRRGALWHLCLAWRLFAAVVAWRPDVVHIFKPKGPSGLVAAALWILRRWTTGYRRIDTGVRRPASIVVDSDDWEGPGGWNDDPRAGYTPFQRRFFAWQERFGLSYADAWTVASECLRERAIAFGANPQQVFLLPNGFSVFSFQFSVFSPQLPASSPQPPASSFQFPASSPQPPALSFQLPAPSFQPPASSPQFPASSFQPPALLYTRFAGVRAADVIAIWAAVRARLPEAVLTVVGRGLAGEERELVSVPGIELVGWVEPEGLPAIFAKSALAVIPWADTPANRARSSVKVRELMAAGLPLVAYAVGELPATLGDAAVLVPPRDVAAFAVAVVSLMTDRERARALGMAARARVQAEFNWEHLAEIALRAYNDPTLEPQTDSVVCPVCLDGADLLSVSAVGAATPDPAGLAQCSGCCRT